jgi:uncharacterized protein (UPF0264 family)
VRAAPESVAPLFLASVASLDEIAPTLAGGAEIIDLKDPAAGALGAWPLPRIREAVSTIAGKRPVSATVGDLPMVLDVIARQVAATAETGVGFVKVGFFDEGAQIDCVAAAGAAPRGQARLIAVLFADLYPPIRLLEAVRRAGFSGVMLDTARKTGRSLRSALSDADLARFLAAGREQGLMVGLAGALGWPDIAPLAALGPDLLGFRGLLCEGGTRTGALDARRVERVALALSAFRGERHSSSARQATLAAGAAFPAS